MLFDTGKRRSQHAQDVVAAAVELPAADLWCVRNGKVEKFNCFVGYSVFFSQMGVNWDWASAVHGS